MVLRQSSVLTRTGWFSITLHVTLVALDRERC